MSLIELWTFDLPQAQEQLQAEVQRYKAKIEDLEATLAQKGQVGARLLAFLQAQLVQAASPLAHLIHGPHPGHGLAHHSDLSQNCVRM